jgi:hypothetical protein
MLPFDVTIPATVPQGSEIPDGLMNNPVYLNYYKSNLQSGAPGGGAVLGDIRTCNTVKSVKFLVRTRRPIM